MPDAPADAPSGGIWQAHALSALAALGRDLGQREAVLSEMLDQGRDFLTLRIQQALEAIRAFEPSVSILGQVKSGKSTLINALLGQDGLLPADVNPWTSVITSLHVNSRQRPVDTRALFRFFDAEEWDRLVQTGGRLGEMAGRAGFQHEAQEIRSQIRDMRQSTKDRFGAEFPKLLGASHAYPQLDPALINRYICYGDPDDLGMGAQDGVFADLTRSADLYLDLPGLPAGFCLRDTPGVNDTFLMREQITLNAISETRVCVIVLSAHQALSSTDLALLRIICSVEAREVILFVNRIDELADPHSDCAGIESSIRATLARTGMAERIQILFGSGRWALAADAPGAEPGLRAASGIEALHHAIAARLVDGAGAAMLRDIDSRIAQIREMRQRVKDAAAPRLTESPPEAAEAPLPLTQSLPLPPLGARMRDGATTVLAAFATDVQALRAGLARDLEESCARFTEIALDALQTHVDSLGTATLWVCDPASLRLGMRDAFLAAASGLRRRGDDTVEGLLELAQSLLDDAARIYDYAESLDYPELPDPAAPTLLARTLSLDPEQPWWRRFWRFGQRAAAASRYRQLIQAETAPLIQDMLSGCFDPYAARLAQILADFAGDQAAFLDAVAEAGGIQPPLPERSVA